MTMDVMDKHMDVGLTKRGQPMPQTIEEWKHLAELYEVQMLSDKEEISRFKRITKNQARIIEKLRYRIYENS